MWDLSYEPPTETARIGLEGVPIHLSVRPDRKAAAVVDLRGNVTYLDLVGRTRVGKTFGGRKLSAIACLDDGTVALGMTGEVVIWDPVTDVRGPTRRVGGGRVTSLAPLGGGECLVGTDKGAIYRFRLTDPSPAWITMLGGHAVRSLALEAEHVLVTMRLGALIRLDLESGGTHWELDPLAGTQAVVSGAGEGRAVVGGTHRTLCLVDTERGQPVWPAWEGHLGGVEALSFTEDGGLVSAATDGARGWTLENGALKPSWSSKAVFTLTVAAARDGTVLSSELLNPLRPRSELEIGVRVHRALTAPWALDTRCLSGVALSPNGRFGYAFGDDPDRVNVLDLEQNGSVVAAFTLGGSPDAVAFSADSSRVALACGESLTLRTVLGEHLFKVPAAAESLTFLPNRAGTERLLVGKPHRGLELRELTAGGVVQSFAEELRVKQVCTVAPDRFLTLGNDGRVLAWDLNEGLEPVAELTLDDETDHAVFLAGDPATQRMALATGKGRVAVFGWPR